MGIVFLLALLLPLIFGTQVSAPRSPLDILSGFSKFNLSLSKLLFAPTVGLGLTIVVYLDPSLPRIVSLVVFMAAMSLVAAALTLGARRTGRAILRSKDDARDDSLDYGSRFRRLEDGIESESPPQRH
jgi:hypothetical protein